MNIVFIIDFLWTPWRYSLLGKHIPSLHSPQPFGPTFKIQLSPKSQRKGSPSKASFVILQAEMQKCSLLHLTTNHDLFLPPDDPLTIFVVIQFI